MTTESQAAAAFPAADEAAWRKAVDKALKGAPFERLRTTTADGIVIEPIYQRAAGAAVLPGRPAGRSWGVIQRVDHPDPAAAHDLLMADLEGGATGITLVLDGAPSARGGGVVLNDLDALSRLFADLLADAVTIRLEAGTRGRAAAALLAAWAEARRLDPASLDIAFGLDPLSSLAATGHLWTDEAGVAAAIKDTVTGLVARGFRGPFLAADGRVPHAAGASDAQELAFVLAAATAGMRWLDLAGLGDLAVAGGVELIVAADVDQLATIAKLRALRLLWARILGAAALPPVAPRVQAETAWRSMTRHDPWTNMLRGTVGAVAAGVGGATSLTMLPFTSALGLADGFARRVARNALIVLSEEANLHRVADPAAGSGAVETMTEALADRAWTLFQDIERSGGLLTALAKGEPQAAMAATAAARTRDIARRKQPMIGATDYPNIAEAPVEVLVAEPAAWRTSGTVVSLPPPGRGEAFGAMVAALTGGATLADLSAAVPAGEALAATPLTAHRLAEPFERLRDTATVHAVATGAPPRAFLATLGRPADFTARATWMKNLLEAGGIAAPVGDGYATLDALVAAFAASGTHLAVICSSDEVYAREAEVTASALAGAGAAPIVLAGRPGEAEAAMREAGVTQFAFAGMDVVAFLTEIQAAIAATRT